MVARIPRPVLYALAGVVAVGAGVGGRAYADKLDAARNSPAAALNPVCTSSAQCLAITCGGQSFVVASDVPFGTVERIREAWCGSDPVIGGKEPSHCSYYRQCVIGPEPELLSKATALSLADVTELDIRDVRVYPNIASAIIEWEVSAPAASRVTVSGGGEEPIVVESDTGEATRHVARVTGLTPNGEYAYTVEATFRAGVAARATGSFRVLPKPVLR